MKSIRLLAVAGLAVAVLGSSPSMAREQIRIVGSSTVYPFATAVAERFGRTSGHPTPVIESTGSGGGIKLFCAGIGVEHPDITNASRRMKASELETCRRNGVEEVVEVVVGYDGIVIANARRGPQFALTLGQVYQALAAEVPVNGSMVANPNMTWADVDPALPDQAIEVLGPPPTSGTRDAFEELALEAGCEAVGAEDLGFDCGKVAVRSDGPWVDAGENDNLIVSKLDANPEAVGVFGFSFLEQNAAKLKGIDIDDVAPAFDAIADDTYPVSRSLYFYVKKAHVGAVPGIAEYVAAFVDPAASGMEGYLIDKGLIPLSDDAFMSNADTARMLSPLTNL